jgi:hypothetical protein
MIKSPPPHAVDVSQLNQRERRLLKLVCDQQQRTIHEVDRRSDGIYLRGTRTFGQAGPVDSNGYLEVMAIDLIDWTQPTWAQFTDYPEMARQGDWSAIRDTHDLKPMVEAVIKHLKQGGLI